MARSFDWAWDSSHLVCLPPSLSPIQGPWNAKHHPVPYLYGTRTPSSDLRKVNLPDLSGYSADTPPPLVLISHWEMIRLSTIIQVCLKKFISYFPVGFPVFWAARTFEKNLWTQDSLMDHLDPGTGSYPHHSANISPHCLVPLIYSRIPPYIPSSCFQLHAFLSHTHSSCVHPPPHLYPYLNLTGSF